MIQRPNLPFKPSKFPFFYGWIILFAGTIGVLSSIPGQTMGISVFTDYLIDALSLSRVQLSFAYMLGTISSALLLTKAGKLYDKYGARLIAILAAITLGFVLLSFSRIDYIANFFQNILPIIPSEYIAFSVILVGFFLIRFSGQGVLTLASRNMAMKWFDKRRGLANGIKGILVSFGFSFSPRIYNSLIDSFTWRGAWTILAITTGVIFVIFALIFFRDNPQQCGCKPDGNIPPPKKNSKRQPSMPDKDFTLQQVRKTYLFWMFNLSLTMSSLYITAFTFHIVSIFETANMARDEAVAIFLPASIIAVFFTFGSSWLSDYIKLKYFLFIFYIGMLISMSALMFFDSSQSIIWMLILGNGITGGLFGLITNVSWPRYFGTTHLGSISGFSMGWIVAGSAIGPYLFSLSKRYYGSYSMAAVILFVITAILLLMSFRIKTPKYKAL